VNARLRQVALVARELEPAIERLRGELGLGEPYRDPEVAVFGLQNAVFAVGGCFLEIVSPTHEGTAAGRHLDRLGGDGGYMAMFQVDDFARARARVSELGVRIAWEIELEDIAGMHLDPRDLPGAIVSLDCPVPPESWRWAGTAWRRPAGGTLTDLVVEVPDPAEAERRWTELLGPQPITFVPGDRGIVSVRVVPGNEMPDGTVLQTSPGTAG
jgi:catechol 2,3-dioxygenase-like lactoylglutathione lyase family enzyme